MSKIIKKLILFFVTAVVFCCVLIGLLFIYTFFNDESDITYFGWKEKYVENFGCFKLPFGVEFHQDEATGLVYFTDLYQNIIITEIDASYYKGDEIAKHTYNYQNDEVMITEIEDFKSIASKTTYTYKIVKAKINDKTKDVLLYTWYIEDELRYFLFTNEKYSTRYGERISGSYINEDEYLKKYVD